MLNTLARLTMAKCTNFASTGIVYELADDPSRGSNLVSIFASPTSLTFPVVVGMVKAAWAGAQALPLSGMSSVWLPFAVSAILGMLVTVSNLRVSARSLEEWAIGLVIGFLNSLLLFAAVLGISPEIVAR